MPHDDYMVQDLIRWHQDKLPTKDILNRHVQTTMRRDPDGNPRITIHNGGFGPELYSRKSCKQVRLTVISNSARLAEHIMRDKTLQHENATIEPCTDCHAGSENVQALFTQLAALGRAAAHGPTLDHMLMRASYTDIEDLAAATNAVTLLELRRKIEVPQSIGGLPPMHPDCADPDRLLGTWWQEQFDAWQPRLRELIAARRTQQDWAGPVKLVAPFVPRDKPGPDREQGALWPPVVSGDLGEYMATGDIVAYVPWPQEYSPGPVFAIPAHVDLDSSPGHAAFWANLGDPSDIADLPAVLSTIAVAGSTRDLDRDTVTALVAAVGDSTAA